MRGRDRGRGDGFGDRRRKEGWGRAGLRWKEEIWEGPRGGGMGLDYDLRKNEGSILYWRWAEKWTIE